MPGGDTGPDRGSPADKGRIEIVSAEEFLTRASEDQRAWLAEKLLTAQSHIILNGRPKTGKSHTSLQIAFDLSCGIPVFGRFSVQHPAKVLYVEVEEPEATTKQRFAAMLRAHGGVGPEKGIYPFSHATTCTARSSLDASFCTAG
jgi:hypothetical protein